ncbi:alpha/beta fold hydrolase [Telmatospirillum sp. J64-1]|uniref:alpha/beta fold hydrolase n=1 Tax=Telmatospirillum sp. J64-1 TaxID=2502183 RepID=UPI002103C7B5|nr:alpha/beta fold hydrolase [Telmatospirillum sp. J64-1]
MAAEAAALGASLQGIEPDLFARAVDEESRRRLDEFLRGLQAYRAHPYRRNLPETPVPWSEGSTRLIDYGTEIQKNGGGGRPVLVVPSLINRAHILDLMPRRSLMRYLADRGLRPFLVDWGEPGEAEAAFTLSDYVAGRLERALDVVLELCGRPPAVIGYCMGGMLALALAQRRRGDLCALGLLATPWDFRAGQPGTAELIQAMEPMLTQMIEANGQMPVDMLQMLFASIDPAMAGRKFRNFARLRRTTQRAEIFVAVEDWLNDGVPLAAEVAKECLFGWYGRNEPARGEWRIGGMVVEPEALDLPTLVMVPRRDRIVPPASALPLARKISRIRCRTLATGHIGMIAGARAKTDVYGPLSLWLKERVGP